MLTVAGVLEEHHRFAISELVTGQLDTSREGDSSHPVIIRAGWVLLDDSVLELFGVTDQRHLVRLERGRVLAHRRFSSFSAGAGLDRRRQT